MKYEKVFASVVEKMIITAATRLPDEMEKRLKAACEAETNATAKEQLKSMIRNLEICKAEGISICQDPGVPEFYVKFGLGLMPENDLTDMFRRITAKVTAELPLRQNITHPLTQENTGTNTGYGIPVVRYEFDASLDCLEIIFTLRGGGSAFRSSVFSTSPTLNRMEAIKKIVLDMVTMAGGIPCPPTLIGIGIGGNPHMALDLAFRQLDRLPIGSHNPDPLVERLEKELYEVLNKTGIGPMGLGGDTTVLAVHMDMIGSHIATIPVAIAFSCWPNRFVKVRFYKDGSSEFLTHKEMNP